MMLLKVVVVFLEEDCCLNYAERYFAGQLKLEILEIDYSVNYNKICLLLSSAEMFEC